MRTPTLLRGHARPGRRRGSGADRAAATVARRLVGVQVVLLVVLAWTVPGLLAPAYAAEGSLCAGEGVNVVVDFGDLGGGVRLACDEDGAGKPATEIFEDTGFDLTPVGAFPGVACRVDGKPEDVGCAEMPQDGAYWGLFLADGGPWGYAPKGADELTLPEGAFVGFSWQTSAEPAPPGVEPTPQESTGESTEAPEADAGAADNQADEDGAGADDSTAWWMPVAVIVVLLGIAGAALLRRRSVTDRST